MASRRSLRSVVLSTEQTARKCRGDDCRTSVRRVACGLRMPLEHPSRARRSRARRGGAGRSRRGGGVSRSIERCPRRPLGRRRNDPHARAWWGRGAGVRGARRAVLLRRFARRSASLARTQNRGARRRAACRHACDSSIRTCRSDGGRSRAARGRARRRELVRRGRAAHLGFAATTDDAWIVGSGWDQSRWPGAAFPVHDALSAALPERPVMLRRVDGHAVLVNAKAMTLAGITPATEAPPGGRILHDDAGNPTGVFIDSAIDPIVRVVPPPSHARLVARRMPRSLPRITPASLRSARRRPVPQRSPPSRRSRGKAGCTCASTRCCTTSPPSSNAIWSAGRSATPSTAGCRFARSRCLPTVRWLARGGAARALRRRTGQRRPPARRRLRRSRTPRRARSLVAISSACTRSATAPTAPCWTATRPVR